MAANSYLTKIFSSNGNRKTMTISFWMKRSQVNFEENLFGSGQGSVNSFCRFEAGSTLKIFDYNGQADQWILETSRQFLDTSSWYHIHYILDSTQSTAADRVQLYVNGVRETAFNTPTYPNQNTDFNWNSAAQSWAIGAKIYGGITQSFFNGYMAYFNFVDGASLAPTVFGQTDSTTGEWKPVLSPSVTYGSNGFFLKFEDPNALGTDSSGNNNTFTVNGNLKQSTDTPNNNFLILDANQSYWYGHVAYGGTAHEASVVTAAEGSASTLMVKNGKWYAEFKAGSTNSHDSATTISIAKNGTDAQRRWIGLGAGAIVGKSTSSNGTEGITYQPMMATPNLLDDGGGNTVNYGVQATVNDIIMMAVDLDNGKIWFGKNGTWFNAPSTSNVGNPATGANAGLSFDTGDEFWGINVTSIIDSAADLNAYIFCNFGQGRFGTTAVSSGNADANGFGVFEYDVPTGFYAMCTKNIKNYG
jgi:hypothetical protein